MRKILLLGTMLGVAGTALAFGGVFNHGSKSTTYKGGVDAIGVHFGGEKKTADSQPEEETCPAEKQCGETCCGHDNVCNKETNECCTSDLDWCCNAPQVAYKTPWNSKECCNGVMYSPRAPYYYCCPEGSIVHGPLECYDGETYYCCPNGEEPYCMRDFGYGCSGYGCYNPELKDLWCVEEGDGFCGHRVACDKGQVGVCTAKDDSNHCMSGTCQNAD